MIILDTWIRQGHILSMAKLFEGFRTGRACECHALQMAVPGKAAKKFQTQRIADKCQRETITGEPYGLQEHQDWH